jgi:uncharacterized alpha-E superfamily protein
MWRVLSSLGDFRSPMVDLRLPDGAERDFAVEHRTLSAVLDLLNRTVLTVAAFGGLAMESMTRGQGWRFLDMGRRLERSLSIISLIHSTLGVAGGSEGPLLEAVLEIMDSSMTYRRRYLSSLQTAAVLDLLLADETNPRSLAYQMVALAEDVESLPRESMFPGRSSEQKIMLATLTALRMADLTELAQANGDSRRSKLEDLLHYLQNDLPTLSDSITRGYLSHLQASRHLSGRRERGSLS